MNNKKEMEIKAGDVDLIKSEDKSKRDHWDCGRIAQG